MSRVVQIIYGKGSGIPYKIVQADSLVKLGGGRHAGNGDDSIIVNAPEVMTGGYPDLVRINAMIAEKRGKPCQR